MSPEPAVLLPEPPMSPVPEVLPPMELLVSELVEDSFVEVASSVAMLEPPPFSAVPLPLLSPQALKVIAPAHRAVARIIIRGLYIIVGAKRAVERIGLLGYTTDYKELTMICNRNKYGISGINPDAKTTQAQLVSPIWHGLTVPGYGLQLFLRPSADKGPARPLSGKLERRGLLLAVYVVS
jgi:hypothetical protein